MIYLIFQLMHLIRKLILIRIWGVAKDPTIAQTKVDLIAIVILVIPEIIWYIYGNTIVYSGEMH